MQTSDIGKTVINAAKMYLSRHSMGNNEETTVKLRDTVASKIIGVNNKFHLN